MVLWNNSLIHGISEWFSDKASQSVTAERLEAFYDRPDPAEASLYGRLLRLIGGMLLSVGSFLECSVFYGVICWLKKLYFRITENSFVFSAVNRISLHRWFLILFSLYLPVDWILRDVVKTAALSSVWDEIFMAVGIFLVLWRAALAQDRGRFMRATTVGAVLILYISVMFMLMMIVRPNTAIAVAGFRAQVQYTLWFFIILRLIEDPGDAKTVLFCFAGLVFVLSLHGIYQFIIGVPIPASWVTSSESGVRTRVFSIIGSPNLFGTLLVMAAPIPAALIYYLKKPLHKFLALCATGCMCLCDLFTFSKASWGALAITVIIFAVFVDRRLLLALAAGVAGILVAVPSIANRLTFIFSKEYEVASSIGGRALRWATGRQLLADSNPWLGFGLGRFGGAVAMNNQVIDTKDGFSYFYMDNYYLKTMVEAGYIGLLAFILLLVAFTVCGFKAMQRAGKGFVADRSKDELFRNIGNDKLLAAALFSGMCGVMFHCYFENIFEQPYMMAYFWGLAAVLLSMGDVAKERLDAELELGYRSGEENGWLDASSVLDRLEKKYHDMR